MFEYDLCDKLKTKTKQCKMKLCDLFEGVKDDKNNKNNKNKKYTKLKEDKNSKS